MLLLSIYIIILRIIGQSWIEKIKQLKLSSKHKNLFATNTKSKILQKYSFFERKEKLHSPKSDIITSESERKQIDIHHI